VKRKRNTPEQIVTKLRQAQMEIGKGATVDQVSRRTIDGNGSTAGWKSTNSGGSRLERENGRLKKIVAEEAMDIDALKEIKKMVSPHGRRRAVEYL